jgi:DNA-binding NarL/FixJ family response regulator
VTRVAVADDHSLVREGLRALLSTVADVTLVATASTAQEALRVAVTQHPDVLVLDIGLPDGSGIEVARELRRVAPDTAVLMLTMYDDADSVFAAMRAGARGYVLKGAEPADIIRAIQDVAAGSVIFGPGIASRALSYLEQPRPEQSFPTLTSREREVLTLIAAGLGNATIAEKLGISPNTIANHVSSIFGKLQVATRAEAIVKALDSGLGRE